MTKKEIKKTKEPSKSKVTEAGKKYLGKGSKPSSDKEGDKGKYRGKSSYSGGYYSSYYDDDYDGYYSSYYSKSSKSSNGKKGKSYSSDYWRGRYKSWGSSYSSEASNSYNLEKCLHDVSRIANIYDPDISLAYKQTAETKNDVRRSTIYLDPRTAVNDKLDLGKKIDIYAGEILLGTALRNSQKDEYLNYASHLKNIQEGKDPLKVASSALFLSMEMNGAFHKVSEETPGFKSYCYSRVDNLLDNSNKGADNSIKLEFEKEDTSPTAKVAALIREIDTFNSSPLECYGDFNDTIEEIMEHVEELKTSDERLRFAKKVAARYVKGVESPEEVEMMSKSFRSGPTMGDGEEDADGSIEALVNKMTKEQKDGEPVRKILERKVLDGAVRKVKVTWIDPTEHTRIMRGYHGTDYRSESYHAISSEVQPITDSILEKLSFVDTDHLSWEEHSLRNGELDEGGLQKLAMDSDKLFFRREVLSLPSIQIGILIDESGSMGCWSSSECSRADNARKLAIAIANAIKQIKGIDLYVFGHSGESECSMYQYVTPESDEDGYASLTNIQARCQNYDSYAIKSAGEKMIQKGTKEYSRRLLFVISDGSPSGYNYGGKEAMKHMKSVSEWLREDCGLEVYGLGVDNAYPESCAEKMFGKHYNLVLPDFNMAKVANLISTFLEGIAQTS